MDTQKMLELAKNFSTASIEEIVEAFNPANAQTIPDELLSKMPEFTDDQIKALAAAYPNKPTAKNYLILKDTNIQRQTYPRSTFANYFAVRINAAQRNYVALTFVSRFNEALQTQPMTTAPVQDLTQSEKEQLPGLKIAPAQTAGQPQQTQQQTAQPQQAQPPVSEPGNGLGNSSDNSGDDFDILKQAAASKADAQTTSTAQPQQAGSQAQPQQTAAPIASPIPAANVVGDASQATQGSGANSAVQNADSEAGKVVNAKGNTGTKKN